MTLMILVLIAGALFAIWSFATLWLVFTIRDFMRRRG